MWNFWVDLNLMLHRCLLEPLHAYHPYFFREERVVLDAYKIHRYFHIRNVVRGDLCSVCNGSRTNQRAFHGALFFSFT